MGFAKDQSLRLVRFIGTRPFKTEHSKTPITARVHLDYGRDGGGVDGHFGHPTLVFGREYRVGDKTDWTELASVRFQRHRIDQRDPFSGDRPWGDAVAGFMGQRGRWSPSYAPEFRVNAETPWLGASLLRLIERSRTALGKRQRRAGISCDLLAMIVGLRSVGVDVVVVNPHRNTAHLAQKAA